MTSFQVHTLDTAPRASRDALAGLEKNVGMLPNLAATMAESPELLTGFLAIREILVKGSFDEAELQTLALTNAFENRCSYTMSFHTAFARKADVSASSVEALRRGQSPVEGKLAAMSDFSRKLVKNRGQVSAEDLAAFLRAGYTKSQALEVVLGVAASVLTSFAHHITQCPVDGALQEHLWTAADR